MKNLIAVIALVFVFPALAQTNICSTKGLAKFDPHQSSGTLESYLTSKLYLPFFAQKNQPGVITNVKKLSDTAWELEISPDISFQEFNGWKPKRKLNAQDVVYSIKRQLLSGARTVAEEESFISAKLSGLEKFLVDAKATGPLKVELSFRRTTAQADLTKFFAFPSGTVVSKEYVDSGKSTDFFPAYGTFEFQKITPSQLTLRSRNGKETQNIIFVSSYGLTYKTVQDKKCKRLYYAPAEIVTAAKAKKIPATAVPVSSSKLYFRLNPIFKFTSEVSAHLRETLSPGAFPSLSSKQLTNQFFGKSIKIGKTKSAGKIPTRKAYAYYCKFPQLGEEELEGFLSDFRKAARERLKMEVSLVELNCESLAGVRPAPDTFGVLNAYEYRTQAEVLEAFKCENVTREIFGFCQNHVSNTAVIDTKLSELQRIFPIAELQSHLIEVF